MSDMSDDDSVEFMGTVPAEAAASPVSTAPAPKPEKRKLLKTKAKAGAGKTKTQPAKPKKTLGDDKPKGKAKATKAKATGLVKEKAALKPKRVVKKKASAPAPLRPTGMLSVLDLCSTADDGEETEDEDLRSQSSGSFGGPHVSNGDYDVAMSSADEDSASVVDSDNGSIRTPPRKRVKKAGKAPAPGNDTGDEDDTVDEGWSDHNRWYCNICKDGGELLCCDRCPRAFHMSCLGMPDTSIPDTEWYCKMCTECLDRRRVKKENREKARLEREAAKLERDANKRKMQQMKEDIIAQKNAEAIENKAKRVLEMQDRILSRKKIKYKDKEEEKLGRLAEDLAQTVRVAKDKLEKLEKEDAALRKKEEAFNKKKRGGGEEHGADEDATTTKSDKPTPAACVYGNVASDFTGDLLAVWDCLNSFSSIVEIAPFTLDQLAAALTHSETAPLITEIHMCLLNVILEDREEEDYVSDDEASMDEAERFRYEIQHAPVTIGVPTSNLLNSVSWPSVLFNLTMAVPRYSSSLTDDLKDALDALNEKEYPSLLLRQKLSLLKFLIGRAYSTEKFRLLLGKHVSEGINASKEYSRAALQDRKIALEEEKKLREKQRVELAELVEKGKGSVKTWLKNDKKSANGSATDTASVDGDDQDKKAESGAPTPAASASTSDSEMEDLTEEAIVKNEEDLEKLLNDSLISRHEYLSRKKHLEAQREKLRKRTEEKMKKQKALEQLERKRASAKKSIQEGLVSKDPALLRIAIEKGKECDLPDRIIVSSQHVLEILEAEAIREEEAEERKKKFNKTMRDLFVRTEPLGRDKNGLRYWCFREDKCHLYVEKPSNFDIKKHYEGSINSGELDHASWFYYGSKAEVTALIESLDERNLAEASLKNALKENFDMITDDMPSSKPGLLMSDLNDSEGKKRGSKARQSSADVEDPESFLSWKNTKKTWKKKNHLESDVDAFRQDLVDVEMWVSKRLKELGSSWHDTGRPDWVKSVKAMESVTDAIKPVLALENEVMSFQLRAQTLLAGSSTVDRAAKLAPSTANGESASVSDASGKDPDKSDEEDEDDDEDMEEEEAAADDGSMLWPTRKSRDRWIAAVAKARTFATLSAALGSFVQRLDIFGLSEVAMDESTVTTRRAKSEKEKQSRKERAVKKKQKKEAEEAEIEDRHSVDDWEEDCYICTEGGELLCCDGCPRVFHFPCVGLRRVPRGKTFCHYCDPSVKPVYPVMGNRATTRAKVERDDVVATDSVEETGEDDSDEDESDVELAVDAASLNASTAKHSDDQWDVECGVCRLGGELLCCDGCPRAFHTKCIDLKHVPEDEWFCDECNLQTCGSCKKNKIRLDSHVICGSEDGTKGCEQVFHLKCAKLTAVPDDDWYCTKCRKTIQK